MADLSARGAPVAALLALVARGTAHGIQHGRGRGSLNPEKAAEQSSRKGQCTTV